jgi:hypothetical protein
MTTTVHTLHLARRRLAVFALALAVLLVAFYAMPVAQTPAPAKKAMTIDDYTKWRSISGQEMSSDGKWLVYTLQGTNVTSAFVSRFTRCSTGLASAAGTLVP